AHGGERHGQRDQELPPALVELRFALAFLHRVGQREAKAVVGVPGVQAQQLPRHLQRRLLGRAQQRQLDGNHQLVRHGARGRVARAAVVLQVHVVALHHAAAGLSGRGPLLRLGGGPRVGSRGRRALHRRGVPVGVGVLAFLRSSLTPNCFSTASRAVASSISRKPSWRPASASAGWKTTS
uniref:Uncharacterized protein n=1 Tax=Nannospalax galili TaxID=1026970 RepID=A0A8C6W512_NANGA